jgi:competence protein ComEC
MERTRGPYRHRFRGRQPDGAKKIKKSYNLGMRDRVFYSICFGLIFGVLWRSFFFVNLYFTILLGTISLAIFLILSLVKENQWGIITSIFIFAFCLGIFRFHLADVPAPDIFESRVGQKVSLTGEIINEPSIGENNQKLTVLVQTGKDETDILLSTALDTDYKYGDQINFSGKLTKPENFITDQGKEFDYVDYLRKDGILYVMNNPQIEITSHSHGNYVKSFLFAVKEKFLEKMNLAIRTPENIFMGGLILGEKSSFSKELTQSFINTGTIHIVALSGYNVTIVAEWFMKIFAFLPKNLGIGMGILAILLFIIMTGGSSTAIRAGIMATLALVARMSGRNYDVSRALMCAGVLMIILNPFVLVYDVSFQLSFLATVAVIYCAPRIEKYFLWVTERFELRDIVSITVAAYIFVFPFILYKMGNLSLVALPANVLILPFIPFTMMLGFITGFAGIVWYVLAVPFGYISYLFLHYELGVINFFANFQYAALYLSNFPLWITVLIYVYFIYKLFGKSIKNFFEENSFSA